MATQNPSTRSDFYVYALFRENGMPFYIGKGRGNRWSQHECEARNGAKGHKNAIIRMMQANGIEIIKTKIHEYLTEAAAHEYEVVLIKTIGRYPNGPLVNLTDGGEGAVGFRFTPEAAAKRAAQRCGTKRPPDAIVRTAKAHRGLKRSPEARANMIAAKRGTKPSPLATLKAATVTRGKKFTPEHRAKIAEALRGKEKTPEHRAKLAAANIGKKSSAATRAKISAAGHARQARLTATNVTDQISLL